MTIIEKNSLDSPWLFRTKPLQTGQTQSTREVALQLAPIPTINHNHNQNQISTQQQQHLQRQQLLQKQQQQQQQQRLQQVEHMRARGPPLGLPAPVDPKKVVKSSTAPNLPTSHSTSEMFRVI